MSTEEDLLLSSALFTVICGEENRRQKRRFWMRPSLRSRERYGAMDLMKDLILDDTSGINLEYRSGCGFQNFFRMKICDFEKLLNMVAPIIKREDTSFRRAVSADERLAVTLRFLATGDSYHSLSYLFKISKQLVSRIIPDVCDAITSVLQDYIKMPQTESEWEMIENDFNEKWNFPHCVGAFDGKHISLQAPMNSGMEYYNYKSFFSVVLFAVVDANYNFIYANVGCQGRISDGGVFNETKFKQCLQENTMHLPPPRELPGREIATPFVFVADDAFPLSANVMKPYPGLQRNGSKERVSNYRLSRARRVSENTFVIISNVYRVLRRPLLLEPECATKIVMAVLHLHNFLRKSPSKAIYNPPWVFDSDCEVTGEINPGLWRKSNSSHALIDMPRTSRRSSNDSREIRNEFAEYLVSPDGILPFQNNR